MSFKTGFFGLTVLLIMATSTLAQDGLALMKVEAGARPFGMGGAFVAVTADPNATFYNPAAAVGTQKFTVSLGHNSHWENVRIETAYFSSNLTDKTWLHGGIRYAAVDDIESRVAPTAEPDALFSAYDVSFKTGLAVRASEQWSFGAALGWYVEKIDIDRGSAFNIDLGMLYQRSPKIAIGASVTNLGSALTLSRSGQPGSDIDLPTTYRVGGASLHSWGLGTVDAVIIDDDFHLHIGVEPVVHEYFTVRAGYMSGYDVKNFSAGASFTRREFTIDYAFVPYTDNLGTSHLFNLTFTL